MKQEIEIGFEALVESCKTVRDVENLTKRVRVMNAEATESKSQSPSQKRYCEE